MPIPEKDEFIFSQNSFQGTFAKGRGSCNAGKHCHLSIVQTIDKCRKTKITFLFFHPSIRKRYFPVALLAL
jgi:hypothetical protein